MRHYVMKTNGIGLYRFILQRWSRILRKHREAETDKPTQSI